MKRKQQQKSKPADLREACVIEAFRIIEKGGVESLSLRDVARRLAVSHQAPYKHFQSRDHLLAEIISRAFDEFAAFLLQRPSCIEPHADLLAMALRYLEYAQLHPLKYRLMFNTPLPDAESHPRMMRNAQYAFDLLRDRLAQMPLRSLGAMPAESPDLDALFVWSTLHGLASIIQSGAIGKLTERDKHMAVARCLGRIEAAIAPVL
ncbi:TetR/AcrR family transcriptional regulator [soil metagenome]